MATQALYRRYRPRRFSEVRGQDHIVKALRNSVSTGREGQAYLFSGPRGTGKTSSARILAKVLNCANPIDGEPCCECESCIAVERGTSYDVHELDAASNNGVDAMRDLIEKASLGTPGRHKVYILDEVHMLSKQAEAALLKTLEEPPPHVVFVLATTDPQKISETIRSRTLQLRFHLLPMDELEAHVRWVVADAGLQVSDAAIMAALEQGGGSARDTLSALELAASSGEDDPDVIQFDEFVEALIELDPGRALTAVAFAVQQGRDARGLTEDIVRHLRDCFLSLMAPELVALPDQKATVVAEQATRLGAARLVRAMERLGEMLVEMRHAPDPRLLLEVALVQLTHEPAANDVGALMDRLDRVEKAVAEGVAAPAAPVPVDPSTGRVQLGGRAHRDDTGSSPRPAAADPGRTDQSSQASPSGAPSGEPPGRSAHPEPPADTGTDPPPVLTIAEPPAAPAAAITSPVDHAAEVWSSAIVPTLKPFVRSIYSVPRLLGVRDGRLTLGAPNEAHRAKCEQHRGEVEAAAARVAGGPVPIALVVEAGGTHQDDHDDDPRDRGTTARVVPLHPAGPPPADDDVDIHDLVDAPPDTVVSPIDRLAQAFPGSELIDERR
jgi:DNA polymerase III subunit gamma/tau